MIRDDSVYHAHILDALYRFGVDLSLVWRSVVDDVPFFLTELKNIKM